MKNWGLVITLVYALIVLGLLAPAFLAMVGPSTPSLADIGRLYQSWGIWVIGAVFILGEFALLFVSVDTSQKRIRRRAPIVISAITVGLFLMVETGAIILSSIIAFKLDNQLPILGSRTGLFGLIFIPWIVWGVLFYLFYRDSNDPVTKSVAWLFRGSVLELLVAVPCHVIVRRRNECSAPPVTGFGIASGIAIMLMAFGPSVLLLFKKRMEQYDVTADARE
jgi:hypothetical protein